MAFAENIQESGRRAQKAMRVCSVVALSLSLASCGEEEQIAALKSQLVEKDDAIKDLRAQISLKEADMLSLTANLNTSKEQEGYYKGMVEANKDTLAANSKAIEACRTPQNVDAIEAALEEVKKSCATTTSTLGRLAAPTPVAAPKPVEAPMHMPDRTEHIDSCTTQPDAPGCLPNPVTVNEPPTPGGGPGTEDEESMEKTVLLAAAFVACEFYSAGTCTFVLAAVGMQLGMGSSEVRAESQQAYQKLKDEIDERGVAIPNPVGGEPIVLTPKTAGEILLANEAYRNLSDADKKNPCKVIQVYQKVDVIDQFIANLASPLKFRNKTQKDNAKQAARQIDPNLAVWLDRIPYDGDGRKGLSCG